MDERRVTQHVYATFGEISTREISKVVNASLQIVPGEHSRAEGEVLCKVAIDWGIIHAQHAVHSHGLEPAEHVGEGRAGGARTGSTTGNSGGSAHEQRGASDASGNIGDGRHLNRLAVADGRLDTCNFVTTLGLQFQSSERFEIRNGKGD